MNIKESADKSGLFQDVGNERAVIACILQNPDLFVEASSKLSESDFLAAHHRSLYSILSKLAADGVVSFDLMAVIDLAEKRSVLANITENYISALYSMEVDARNFHVYVGFVLDSSTKYKLYKELQYMQNEVLGNVNHSDTALSAETLLSVAESRILDVSMEMKGVEEAIDMSSGLRDRVKQLAENPVEVRGLTSTLPLLDKALNGFANGSLTIVAARQKVGKSLLLMNFASHVAFDLGMPVLYVDTEMRTEEQQSRLLSHLSAVPERSIVNGKFIKDPTACKRIERACEKIEGGVFLHKYYPGYTIEGLKSLIRKYHARYGIGAFFFDYVKVPEVGSGNSLQEHQLLGNVAIALKDLAGQLNIPGIAAAQIKRGDTGTPKSFYHDSDVADSDKIGRYCSNLLAFGRKSPKEVEEDGMDCGTHRLQILLARAGGMLFKGIDVTCHHPTLTVKQAQNQSNGIPTFDLDEDIFE